VLSSVRLCKREFVSSVDISIAAFRATHAGSATITAQLRRSWRSIENGPKRFSTTVKVLP
jgi:hypothetical protein